MNTQHNLSADETKVSFDLLLRTASIAVAYTRTACERNLGQLQTAHFENDLSGLAHIAKSLAESASSLAIAADTLHVLDASKAREKFTLIGKPPLEQQ